MKQRLMKVVEIVSGGNERSMATGETERVLQREGEGEGDSCECMVSIGSKRSHLGVS